MTDWVHVVCLTLSQRARLAGGMVVQLSSRSGTQGSAGAGWHACEQSRGGWHVLGLAYSISHGMCVGTCVCREPMQAGWGAGIMKLGLWRCVLVVLCWGKSEGAWSQMRCAVSGNDNASCCNFSLWGRRLQGGSTGLLNWQWFQWSIRALGRRADVSGCHCVCRRAGPPLMCAARKPHSSTRQTRPKSWSSSTSL
jgi:hypothetical protein